MKAGFTLKMALVGLLALGVAVAVGVIIYRVFYLPDETRTAAAVAKVEVGAAKVAGENAIDAVGEARQKGERETTVERITRENTIRIMAAPGADYPANPDLDREFLAALCLRQATRADPACANVSGTD